MGSQPRRENLTDAHEQRKYYQGGRQWRVYNHPVSQQAGADRLLSWRLLHRLSAATLSPAMILGIIGLRNVRANPEVKGTAHAWIGIISGSVFLLLSIAAFVLFA